MGFGYCNYPVCFFGTFKNFRENHEKGHYITSCKREKRVKTIKMALLPLTLNWAGGIIKVA